jgi:pyridoxal phosphate enzyme (YggS family)
MGIVENLNNLKQSIKNTNVKVVAVSKTHSAEMIKIAYQTGQRLFGENKVQELFAKYEELKDLDIKWHLIGHLQTNKVKYIVSFIDMIHSVDSLKLLKEINRLAEKESLVINCLLQFYIAKEETKFGLDYSEAEEILNSSEFKDMKNVRICGVMGMASFSDNMDLVRNEFRELKQIFEKLKQNYFSQSEAFCELSMGMSSDWKIAVEEGSTIIRVGSNIFGNRIYT